ncbi:MAG: NAD-binding protein [Deltaproteobacteria bacterium]|nr:NAD-binding protein [Deltaproteobacteria bacterium]
MRPGKTPSDIPLAKALLVLCLVFAAGTVGYSVIEGWDFLDSLYMTIITITNVGFGEVRPLHPMGRLFTIFLLLFSIGTVTYFAAAFARGVVEGELLRALGRRRLEKKIQALFGHYIICGFGRIGGYICRELSLKNVPIVVIESDPETALRIDQEGYLYIRGNATDDEVLRAAGVEKARGLVTAVASDADNLYITLSAREMNPDLFILARSSDLTVEKKLRTAGANLVVAPYILGARRMVNAILRPAVMDFIEIALHQKTNLEMLRLDEIPVKSVDRLDSQVLKDSGIRSKLGLMVVAVQKPGSHMMFNPSPETVIDSGDILICLGQKANLEGLELLVGG